MDKFVFEELLKLVNSLLPVFTALGGALLAGYFSTKNNRELIKIEQEREKRKVEREETIQRFEVYNIFLRVDGENNIITPIGGSHREFDINLYVKTVRRILYEKYHLLNSDVAEEIANIDLIIERCNYYEEITRSDHELLCSHYYKLEKNIKKHIYQNRINVEKKAHE